MVLQHQRNLLIQLEMVADEVGLHIQFEMEADELGVLLHTLTSVWRGSKIPHFSSPAY